MNVFATADICFHELILSASTSAGWTGVDINYDGAAKYGGATEFMKDLGSPAFFDVDITQKFTSRLGPFTYNEYKINFYDKKFYHVNLIQFQC